MSQSAFPPAPQPQHPSKTPDRRRFVQAMIATAALLFIATEAVLYYRWATMSEPSSVLLIDAGPSLNGAEIIVDGVKLAEPLRATIGLNDRYSIPFYLDEDRHDVQATIGREVQYTAHTDLRARFMQTIDLKRFRPTTRPAAAPAGTAFP